MCSPLLSASSYLHAETVTGLHLYPLRRTCTRIVPAARRLARTRNYTYNPPAGGGLTCAQTALEQRLINVIIPLGIFWSSVLLQGPWRLDHFYFTYRHTHTAAQWSAAATSALPTLMQDTLMEGGFIRSCSWTETGGFGDNSGRPAATNGRKSTQVLRKLTGRSTVGNGRPQQTTTKRESGRRDVR